MKKILLFFNVLALLFYSCASPTSETGNGDRPGFFWAINSITGRYYQVDAELLAEGLYCKVWVEKGCGVNSITAQTVANKYDYEIYPVMIENFGFTVTINGKSMNTMQYADWLVDGDGKLCILLLDIKDNYHLTGVYTAGYFWSGNFYPIQYSNKRNMIYIDTNPGFTEGDPYTTIVHEMQHLMNFAASRYYRYSGNYTYTMDTWIDEGLSSAAEWLYKGEHLDHRLTWYNFNGNGGGKKGDIDIGNNFFVWGNHDDNPYALMDDYATVYLFFQWLRLQKDTAIYKKIINSEYSNYFPAVTYAFYNNNDDENNWETLLKTWLTANYAPNGSNGYQGDSDLLGITATQLTVQSRASSLKLSPGEGVYSKHSSSLTSGNIVDVDQGGGIFLTYNKDSNNGNSEVDVPITLTSVSMPALNMSAGSRSVQPALSGPFPISAGDMLRRNGRKEGLTSPDMTESGKRFVNHE